MENTKIDFQQMQALYFVKYGYKFDETALAMLLILDATQQKRFAEQNVKLNTAVEKIKTSQKTLEVDTKHPHWQAFWFGMGNLGLALIMAIAVSSMFYTIYLNRQREQDAMPVKLKWYEDFYQTYKETKSIKAYLKDNPMPK
jgi:hypothetical protein